MKPSPATAATHPPTVCWSAESILDQEGVHVFCTRLFVCRLVPLSLSLPPSLVSPPFLSTLYHFSVSVWHSLLVRVEHTHACARARYNTHPRPRVRARSGRARVYTHEGAEGRGRGRGEEGGIEIQSGIGRRYTRNLIINKCERQRSSIQPTISHGVHAGGGGWKTGGGGGWVVVVVHSVASIMQRHGMFAFP